MTKIFSPADVLIPKAPLRKRFAVVACDQYTSQPEYWEAVEAFVGDAPSAYRMIIPESSLSGSGLPQRIGRVNEQMERYLRDGVFDGAPDSYVYVERTLRTGGVRRGIVGKIDLTAYDFSKKSTSPVRATEATVLERIPPRVQVRENAALEMPHVMLLIDDASDSVIGPLRADRARLEKLYDFPLMMDSGSVAGWRVDAQAAQAVDGALESLAEGSPMVFAVGDGNHSLASAKEHYNRLCEKFGKANMEHHPARYALVEVVNLYDESLEFEPIHRVIYDIDRLHFEGKLRDALMAGETGEQSFELVKNGAHERIQIGAPTSSMTVGTVQGFVDEYIQEFGGRCDYIHGNDVLDQLSMKQDALGLLLPPIRKDELFRTVLSDGSLTRKTFSMGNACDKRFYLECRAIRA